MTLRIDGERRPIVHPQLLIDPLQMVFHRSNVDAKRGRYFFTGHAECDHTRDLDFAFSQGLCALYDKHDLRLPSRGGLIRVTDARWFSCAAT